MDLRTKVVSKSVAQVRPVQSEHPNGEFELVLSDGSKDRDGEQLKAQDWQPLPAKITIDTDHAWVRGMSVPLTAGSGKPFIDQRGRLIVKGTFAGTEHGQLVRRLVNEGHIFSASVSYIEHKQAGGRVTRELLNGTFTGVPSNPNAVVLTSKSFKGENVNMYEARLKSLESEFGGKVMSGECSTEEADEYQRRWHALDVQVKSARRAAQFSGGPSDDGSNPDPAAQQQQQPPFTPQARTTKAMRRNELAFSPFHLTNDDWRGLIHAAEAKAFGYTVSLADTAYGQQQITKMKARLETQARMKAPAYSPVEGAAGSLLEPLLMPDVFRQELEPDRIWSHLPGMPMDSQSVAYLRVTGNAQPAGITPEGGTIPDVQMQVQQFTATAVKVDGIASVTRELLDDYDAVLDFVPSELSRLIIDRETNFVINDATAGILATPGILTRNAAASVTGIDAILAGVDDIRVATGAFAEADLIAMHPTTWLSTRLTRTTTGAYVLRQNEPEDYLGQAQASSFFGIKVVTNTYVPQGVAVIMSTVAAAKAFTRMGLELMMNQYGDSEFQTFGVQFRCVERIALAIVRPTAVCVVSGLLSNPAGGS